MDRRSILAIVELGPNYLLAVAVCEEVDGAGWDNAYKIWAQAFKQCTPPLNLWNGKEDLKCLSDVEKGAAPQGKGGRRGYATSSAPCGQLVLVVVGLQAGFDHVQRGGYGA